MKNDKAFDWLLFFRSYGVKAGPGGPTIAWNRVGYVIPFGLR